VANELVLPPGNASGLTVTAKVYSKAGSQVGSDVSCSEAGSTSIYRGDMPTASQGVYLVHFTANTGADLGTYEINWTGSGELTNLDLATGAQILALNDLSSSDITSAVPAVSAIQAGLATAAQINNLNNLSASDITSAVPAVSAIQTGLATAAQVAGLNNLSSSDVTNAVPTVSAIQTGLATGAQVQGVEDKVDSVKLKTDGLNFDGDDLKATLDGEEVTTDAASREASKANLSDLATQTDVAGLATAAHLQEVEDKVDTVKTVADGIKVKSDGLNFDGADVKATLDGEEVTTDADSRLASQANVSSLATAAQLTTAESNIRGINNRDLTEVYGASGTSGISAIQSTVDAIKLVIDKLTFNSTNDVVATLEGEAVTTDNASRLASQADVALLTTINNAIAALNNLSGNDVLNQVNSALGTYDPPTKAEMDSFQAGISALINGLNNLAATDVRSQTDAALAGHAVPTKAELDAGLASLSNLGASEIVNAISSMNIEGSLTFVEFMRAIAAATAGTGTVSVDGGTVTYSNLSGTKPVLTATVDAAGNRTITKDLS